VRFPGLRSLIEYPPPVKVAPDSSLLPCMSRIFLAGLLVYFYCHEGASSLSRGSAFELLLLIHSENERFNPTVSALSTSCVGPGPIVNTSPFCPISEWRHPLTSDALDLTPPSLPPILFLFCICRLNGIAGGSLPLLPPPLRFTTPLLVSHGYHLFFQVLAAFVTPFLAL